MLTPEMYMRESTMHCRGRGNPVSESNSFPEGSLCPEPTLNPSEARVEGQRVNTALRGTLPLQGGWESGVRSGRGL